MRTDFNSWLLFGIIWSTHHLACLMSVSILTLHLIFEQIKYNNYIRKEGSWFYDIFECILVLWMLSCFSHVQPCVTLWAVAYQAPPSMDFPGKNTGEGSRSLLQVIFPTQGLNPDLLHCRQILYHLSHQQSPLLSWDILIWSILEGVW